MAEYTPPISQINSGGESVTVAADPYSAREVTLQQLVTAVLAVGTNTDGIEALLTALGVKDDGVIAGLDALRPLLEKLLTTAAFEARIPTLGAKTKAGSLSITLASDQGALTVDTGLTGLASQSTLVQVRDGILALGGNTDGLEALATAQRDLLTTQAAYLDQVETLLSSLGSNTDGLEALLSALGVKDDNVLARLGDLLAMDTLIRDLLAGTLSTRVDVVKTTLAPQKNLIVGAVQTLLTPPAGANSATVKVLRVPDASGVETNGRVYRCIGADADANCDFLEPGEEETITGAELAAYRLTRVGGVSAKLLVEYRVI